jgi:hypothetical protein
MSELSDGSESFRIRAALAVALLVGATALAGCSSTSQQPGGAESSAITDISRDLGDYSALSELPTPPVQLVKAGDTSIKIYNYTDDAAASKTVATAAMFFAGRTDVIPSMDIYPTDENTPQTVTDITMKKRSVAERIFLLLPPGEQLPKAITDEWPEGTPEPQGFTEVFDQQTISIIKQPGTKEAPQPFATEPATTIEACQSMLEPDVNPELDSDLKKHLAQETMCNTEGEAMQVSSNRKYDTYQGNILTRTVRAFVPYLQKIYREKSYIVEEDRFEAMAMADKSDLALAAK